MNDADTITIRRASVDDAVVLARHRAEMFRDMGDLPDELYPQLVEATRAWMERGIPAGEYVAWLASPAGSDEVVAGAGVHLRTIIPRPRDRREIETGPQGLIVNVFTERAWRRRGVAERLMRELLAWTRENGIPRPILHASREGRPLYERLGFEASNEMKFRG
ncbi:GNAT family N-acetyltransferase [Longimicrobium sp.]|uniref:GNAT family N-acetyltransferase n=1 Tax=Longimicrobium sp. TaxID=2029185 RepID=UPI002BD97F42|nr:GNAT family N-acetyltransferase [Longimicrobium sp.]HSU17143.1 GNAT family N-acetyltransferase [Longimicrobium sp.]